MAQSVKVWLWISIQVMISWFMRLSPTLGCVLRAWSLLGILSLSLSLSLSLCLCPSPTHTVSLGYNSKNLSKKKNSVGWSVGPPYLQLHTQYTFVPFLHKFQHLLSSPRKLYFCFSQETFSCVSPVSEAS